MSICKNCKLPHFGREPHQCINYLSIDSKIEAIEERLKQEIVNLGQRLEARLKCHQDDETYRVVTKEVDRGLKSIKTQINSLESRLEDYKLEFAKQLQISKDQASCSSEAIQYKSCPAEFPFAQASAIKRVNFNTQPETRIITKEQSESFGLQTKTVFKIRIGSKSQEINKSLTLKPEAQQEMILTDQEPSTSKVGVTGPPGVESPTQAHTLAAEIEEEPKRDQPLELVSQEIPQIMEEAKSEMEQELEVFRSPEILTSNNIHTIGHEPQRTIPLTIEHGTGVIRVNARRELTGRELYTNVRRKLGLQPGEQMNVVMFEHRVIPEDDRSVWQSQLRHRPNHLVILPEVIETGDQVILKFMSKGNNVNSDYIPRHRRINPEE